MKLPFRSATSVAFPLALAIPLALAAACLSSSSSPGGGDGGGGGNGNDGGPNLGSDGAASDDAGPDGKAPPPDTFAWAQAFTAGKGSALIAMASDASGVVLVGSITGTATIGTSTLTASDSAGNAFVAKLDTSGKVLWAKIAGGSQSLFEAVVIDASGNVIVSGAEYGDAPGNFVFGGTTLTPNSATGKINGNPVVVSAGVLAKLDASGNLTWAKLVETTAEIDLGSVALSGSDIVVAGALDDDAAFGAGETMPVTGCTGAGCVAFAAFDSSGTAKWAAKAPSTPMRNNAAGNPREVWVASDSTGNIVLAIGGYFESSQTSDANQLVTNKYDPSGALTWSKSAPMPAGSGPAVDGLVVDGTGNVYVIGDFAQGLTLGTTTIDPAGGGNYLVKYSPAGDVVWATSPSNPGAAKGLAMGASLYAFGNGDDPSKVLPDGVTPMAAGQFDPSTGAAVKATVCGVAQGLGEAVAVTGASVYVGGDGVSPGVFGRLATTNSGIFVAKLK